jgi:hypothetical protein
MAGIGDLVAKLSVDSAPFSKGLGTASSSLSSFASTATSVLAPLAGLLGGAVSVNALKTQIAAENKLAAVIKATGGAAGLSADEIGKFASELQGLTNFGDEATINSAALLATFKEIKGDVFKDALTAAADLSTVLGSDMKGSIIQIGKALNDPIKGVSALADAGVSFTQQQKDQIKTLQESGDMMGAQSVILKELKGEFGGAAEAMADPWTQAKNALGDTAEMVGTALLPAINVLSEAIIDGTAWAAQYGESFKNAGELFAEGLSVAVALASEFGPGLIGIAVGLTAAAVAFKVVSAAMFLYAQRAAIALALSGPAGWATLAIGIAAAGAATYALSGGLDGVASAQNANTAATTKAERATAQFAAAQAQAAKNAEEHEKRLSTFAQAMTALESPVDKLNKKVAEFQAILVASGTSIVWDGHPLIKAMREKESGFTSMLQGAQHELDVLKNVAGETGVAIAGMMKSGISQDSIDEFKKVKDEIKAINDEKVASKTAADEKKSNTEYWKKRGEEMQAQADAIKDSLRTPEAIQADLRGKHKLLIAAGKLTQEESDAFIANQGKETEKKSIGAQFSGVMAQGSSEAFALLARSQRNSPQVTEQKKTNGYLKTMANKKAEPVFAAEGIG